MRDFIACLGLVLLVSLGACGARDHRPYAEQPGTRALADELAGRRCALLTRPGVPTSVDQVTRPGTRFAVTQWADEASPTDSLDLSVRYGSDGRLDWVRAVKGNVSAQRASDLEGIVRAGLADDGPAGWGFRVRVVGRTVALLPSVVCPPARRPMGTERRPPPVGTYAEEAEARTARYDRIELDVSLNEEGDVLGVRITRSSRSRLMNREAIDRAVWLRYLPALHDGVGIPSVLEVTFTVRSVRRPGPRGPRRVPEVVG
jgi:TonB family protein